MTKSRKKLKKQESRGPIRGSMQVLALMGLLLGGPAGMAQAASPMTITNSHTVTDGVTEEYSTIDVNSGGTLDISRNGKVTGTGVNVNAGGKLTSGKNLHIGTFTGQVPGTGLLADSLTIGGSSTEAADVTASHLGFSTNGTVTVNKYGTLTLDSLAMGSESLAAGKLVISGGTLKLNSLSIANDKLGSSGPGGIELNSNGPERIMGNLMIRDDLKISGGDYTNTMHGGLYAGTLTMDQGATYTHDGMGFLHLSGMPEGGNFFTGAEIIQQKGTLILDGIGASTGPQTSTTTAKVTLNGGKMYVSGRSWNISSLSQKGGELIVRGHTKPVLTLGSLDQTGGKLTLSGDENYQNRGVQPAKVVVTGSFANVGIGSGTGVYVDGKGVLDVRYDALVGADDKSFKDPTKQHAMSVASGGTLNLSGYAGSMTLNAFKQLTDVLLDVSSRGTVSGVNISGVDTSTKIQDVGDAKASVSGAVVDGSGGIKNGAAAVVGGVTGGTAISGGSSLGLTGQGAANGQLTNGNVTLDNGKLVLGNAAGGSTGGMLAGNIDASASSNSNSIDAVNGSFTVSGDIKGGTGTTKVSVDSGALNVGGVVDLSGGANNAVALNANGTLKAAGLKGNATTKVAVGSSYGGGTLLAENVTMKGGELNFDPPFVADGDTSNASLGGLNFASSKMDALINVGKNSMVSLGSIDAEWLRTEVLRYQGDGHGLWGKDITAALAIRAPQTLDAVGGILVDGTWTHGGTAASANKAQFAGKSLLVVDAAGVGSKVALSGAGTGSTLTVDAGAKLHIVGGQGGDILKVTDDFGASTKDTASWTGDNLTTSTGLLSATGGIFNTADGSYSVNLSANKTKLIFPLLSDSMANMVDSVFAQARIDVNASNAGVRFLSRATSDTHIGRNDTRLAAATMEGAAQMAVVGAVPGVTLSAVNAASNAVTTRTSFAAPQVDKNKAVAINVEQNGALSLDSGLSAGSGMKNGLGIWLMPLYQGDHAWGMKAENFQTGYNSDLGGVALGADYTFADAFRVGVALNVGGGFAQSSGDFNKTDNSFNFWGVSLYGGWAKDNFGLTADVGYSSNYNTLKQSLPAAMQMGELEADVTSSAITAGLRGEYKFETSVMDIIPHVGARYTSLNVGGYDVKRDGTVFSVDQNQQSIWTFPVGVTFSKDVTMNNGWTFKPQVDLSIIPATGDVHAKSKSSIPGVGTTAELESQVVDYMTWQGGIGFDVKNDNLSIGINYNIQASEHRTGHGVFGTVRYEF